MGSLGTPLVEKEGGLMSETENQGTPEGVPPRRPRRPHYYFEITSLPASEAPLDVLAAFVGKVFPLMPRNMDGPEPIKAMEVESGLRVNIPDAVCVDMHQVLRVLRSAGEEAAADYWAARNIEYLVFQRSEVR